MADVLRDQDGLYALIIRGRYQDDVEIVTSVSEVHPGADHARFVELIAEPAVSVVTVTITEGGYSLLADGMPDPDDEVLGADVEALKGRSAELVPTTAIGRLLSALDARRRGDAGPIAIVCCDNIPSNGAWLQRGVGILAAMIDPALADWIAMNASFVSTSVDRITPHSDGDESAVRAAGWVDAAPVVTERFADWVLAGCFPGGRPDWESAGARFVDDIGPWEQRKLWMLNGAHTLLAVAGQLKGLVTVDEAIEDDDCRARVEQFWAEAVLGLPDSVEPRRYRDQLVDRFANPRMVHRLEQIASETTTKVQFRFASVAECSIASGRTPTGSAVALASWIEWVLAGPTAADSRAAQISLAARRRDPVRALVGVVSDSLADDDAFLDIVRRSRGSRPAAAVSTPQHVRFSS